MSTFTRPEVWQPALFALLATAGLTPFVIWLARRVGMVSAPSKDRWHSRPTALLGGVGIFAVVVTVVLLAVDVPPPFRRAILPAAALLFLMGLVDDIANLKPVQKLVMQVIAAGIVIQAGLLLPWTSSLVLNAVITMFWLVGITNALNMLDNMDGLAAGVAAIASVFLALHCFSRGQIVEGTVITVLAASLCGFLLYNSQPASIFMGDCGSMFIGFFLGCSALLTTTGGATQSLVPLIAVPVLTLVIPIFDTTFVTLMRKLAGRAASQGGRDHTSHRLVALGLTERRAVWVLYALATFSGLLSTRMSEWPLYQSVTAIAGFSVGLVLFGALLARQAVVYALPHAEAVTEQR
jgi:UDP-GlcNAc:undecaprenyl-phosphate/decaprenyl-phosphate GlcNAc-1-phosphate transferase